MDKKPVRLYKQPKMSIDPMALLIMCIIFAIVFFMIGVAFRHYPSMNWVI